MDAEIIEEDDSWIGVNVVDREGAEHKIAVGFDCEIQGHSQDGYPDDPDNREGKGNEMVDQARDYAKWYVATERGYETVPWYLDTETLETIRERIAALSDEAIEEHFSEFYRQLAGEYDDEVTQPHPDPVPAGRAMNEYREYKLDIYLTEDGTAIDATSGVHTMYYVAVNEDRLVKSDDPYPDRDPDGRLEHIVLDIPWEQFPEFLEYHLRCQIRDSYLARGEDPPEAYRVVGPGTDHMMVRCMTRDYLPPYHDYDAAIDGYRAEDKFNAGVLAPLLDLL